MLKKVKLTSYEDLFGETDQDNGEKITYVPLNKLQSIQESSVSGKG